MNKTIIVFLALSSSFTGFIYGASSNEKELVKSNELRIIDYSPEVVKQEGVDCGLHAVKNALALYRYFTKKIPTKDLFLKQLKNVSVRSYPHMPACRIAVTGKSISRYLGGDQVLAFAQLVDFPLNKITVLENISEPHYTQKERAKLARLVEKIKSGKPVVHAFVLGNMSEIAGMRTTTSGQKIVTTMGTMGHYIAALLIKKPGKPLTFYIADSLGERPEQNILLVSRLRSLLESIDPQKMKFEQINAYFYNALQYLSTEPSTTLGHIERLLMSVKKYRLFNEHFRKNYLNDIFDMLEQIEKFLSTNEKQRLESAREALFSAKSLRAYESPITITEQKPVSSTLTSISTVSTHKDTDLEKAIAESLATHKAKTIKRPAKRAQKQSTRRTTTKPKPITVPKATAPAAKTLTESQLRILYTKARRRYKLEKNAGIASATLAQVKTQAAAGNATAKNIIRYLNLPSAKK